MTDQFTFDLIDEPWIPCIQADDGAVVELGLRATLTQAATLREISDPSPLVTVALHRLLLAILHRTHGPASQEEWWKIWNDGSFDTDRIDAYLDEQRTRGRFDLFHPEQPFYQTTGVRADFPDYQKPMTQLTHELLLGQPPVLFQQAPTDLAFSPARAARTLVALQAFAIGGLIGYQSKHGEPANPFKYSQDAPLKKGAVILNRGETLFETLLLNLHQYDGDQGEPWHFNPAGDLAVWEQEPPPDTPDRAKQEVSNRTPDGYIDLLTWQSRRIRLIPERDGDAVVVRSAVMMRGHGFPDSWREDLTETMLAFRARRDAKPNDPNPWLTLTFDPDRALWRNSLALYRSVDKTTQRPRMADWLADLTDYGYLEEGKQLAVDIFGLGTDRAKIDLWRHERLPLPVALLTDDAYSPLIARALEAAEDTARQLRPGFNERPADGKRKKASIPRPMQLFAEAMLAPDGERSPDRGDIAKLVNSLDLDERYWSRLEGPFRDFLSTLPQARESALTDWLNTIETIATTAFSETMRSFDTSARALKAEALANARFGSALRETLAPHRAALDSMAASSGTLEQEGS